MGKIPYLKYTFLIKNLNFGSALSNMAPVRKGYKLDTFIVYILELKFIILEANLG